MIVVNFFGAPGSGKSTAALSLAGLLKRSQVNAEYVPEFAKDQVWGGSVHMLKMQNWIFANQELRLRSLVGHADVVTTDSPLPLSFYYAPAEYPEAFGELCLHFFSQYENINFYLDRTHSYSPIGRIQTESEALEMGKTMKDFLDKHGISYEKVDADVATPEYILARLVELGVIA